VVPENAALRRRRWVGGPCVDGGGRKRCHPGMVDRRVGLSANCGHDPLSRFAHPQ